MSDRLPCTFCDSLCRWPLDGPNGLDNWNRVGDANWRLVDGVVQADKASTKGSSFLVSKKSYKDFEIRVEFWASDDANSGIYMRCADPKNITDKSCYEANIFDQRPDSSTASLPAGRSPCSGAEAL